MSTLAHAYNSLDITTSLTLQTDVSVAWYDLRSGGWVLLGSGTAASINVIPADQNIIYASVTTSASYYLDYAKTQSMNSIVKSVQYKDIIGDGVKVFVLTLDLTGIPYATSTATYQMPQLSLYGLTANAGSLTAGAQVNTIGTSKVTKFMQNYLTLSAEKTAIAIAKVVIIANVTDSSYVVLAKQNIPGLGYIDGSSFTEDVQATQIVWTYTICSNLYGANFIERPVNTLNYFDFQTGLTLTMASHQHILMTLKVYYLTPAEVSTVLSGTILLCAD